MGQKVHPRGLRLGIKNIKEQHRTSWYADSIDYKKHLEYETFLRRTIVEKYPYAQISKIKIEYVKRKKAKSVQIYIYTSSPSYFSKVSNQIGSVSKLDQLKLEKQEDVRQILAKSTIWNETFFVELEVESVPSPKTDPKLIAESIGKAMENRKPFRGAIKKAVNDALKAGVLGIKIKISGRLNGAEMARSEWIRKKRVPLHTLRANIDYHSHEARTIYGLIGIKVWVFNGMINQND